MISNLQEHDRLEMLHSQPQPSVKQQADILYRELLQRVVSSPTFVRSERLCSLLTYVCDLELKGRGAELNEQRIGQAVFGRSRDYDSTIDGIVRTQASRLRQRLEQYFREEGAEEAIRIIIPRGGYVPVFEPRPIITLPQVAATSSRDTGSEVLLLPAAGTRRIERAAAILPWLLCLLLAGAVVTLAVRGGGHAVPPQASTHILWNQFFRADRPTLVIPADSGLVMYHNLSRRSFGLDEYLLGEYRTNQTGKPLYGSASASPKDWQVNLANRRYTSLVDLDAILSLSQLARGAGSRMEVRYARDVRPNDLKKGDVILIGAAESNPWVELFERNMNFVFADDYATGVFSVINKAPRSTEPARWNSLWNDPQRRVYGLVAYLPNLGGAGNALILEGTSMSGTEGARDFVMDDSQLLPFLERIRRADGTIPHFEVLLGTQNMSASAVHSQLLAWRTAD